MYSQKINRSDPEKVYMAVLSDYATASITRGQAMCLKADGTDDGIAVTQPTTALAPLFVGVATGTIANGAYGTAQCRGYCDYAAVSGSTDVTAGNKLSIKTGSFNLIKAAGTLVVGEAPVAVALVAYTTTAVAAAGSKVWLRAF